MNPKRNTIQDILNSLIDCEPTSMKTGCKEWPKYLNKDGYGKVSFQGKVRFVHKVVYEHFYGPVPEHHEIDHLCRNRKCGNPEHLEAVPHEINIRRGVAPITHCPKGHPYEGDNLRMTRGGYRVCVTCNITKSCEWRASNLYRAKELRKANYEKNKPRIAQKQRERRAKQKRQSQPC